MREYLILFVALYLIAIVLVLVHMSRQTKLLSQKEGYLFAGGKVGSFLGFWGIAASLMSTFALLGLPAFSRNHGVGTWIFIVIADAGFVALLLLLGLKIRKKVAEFKINHNINNATDLFMVAGLPRHVIATYLLGATLFLLPYITIQIKGTAFLFSSVFTDYSFLTWSIIIVSIMYIYSFLGGIKAIFYTDAFQGMIMLVVVWLVVGMMLNEVGGLGALFQSVAETNPELLSTPGPHGLFTTQFFMVMLVALTVFPYTQPALFTRILIVKDKKSFIVSSVGLGIFTMVILPLTIIIGLRGVSFSGDGAGGYLFSLLQYDTTPWIHALYVIGIVAAGMSTTDSIIFSLGTEWGTFFKKDLEHERKRLIIYVKLFSLVVAIMALVLAQLEIKSIVLFATKGFVGLSFLSPIIFSGFLPKEHTRTRSYLYFISSISMVLFILSIFKVIPDSYFDLKIELWIYAVYGTSLAAILTKK